MIKPAAESRMRVLSLVLSSFLIIGLLCLCSMLIGAGDTSISDAWGYLCGDSSLRSDDNLDMVLRTLRWPRTVAALVVGAAMGIAGALLQTVTRNPLADTGLLGINSGAAMGVVIGITYLNVSTALGYLLWALGGTLLGTSLVLVVATTGKAGVTPLRLILAGLGIGSTFHGITAMILLSNQTSYDEYRFWVLGSLAGVNLTIVLQMLWVILPGIMLAILLIRSLSALILGDDVAQSLGHQPGKIRIWATLAVTLLTGACVALAGPITFLGLLSPHVARSFTGHRIGRLLTFSGLFGMIILLSADILCRIVVKPFETPVSVMIAMAGAPLLIWIVLSNRMLTLSHREMR
ncbi:MAG TPA: ABC transporter permease [Phycisphaerales bacterium]|nr:ABC transporter permease [Phycisphaerales bacterium]